MYRQLRHKFVASFATERQLAIVDIRSFEILTGVPKRRLPEWVQWVAARTFCRNA